MKISADRDQILRGIQTVQNIVGDGTMLPILSNMVIESMNGGIQFLATDLKTSISYTLPLKVDGKGAISLPAKKLGDIVRELPEGIVELEVEEGHKAKIHSGKVRYQILGFSKDDFPKLPTVQGGESITLSANALLQLMNGVLYAAAQDDARYILNGCLFTVTHESVRLVATDGHRLAGMTLKTSQQAEWQVILPSKTVSELVRILPKSDDPVTIRTAENKMEFFTKDLKIVASLVEGQFPNIEDILKRPCAHQLQISTAQFLKAVKRVSLVALEKSHAIRMDVQPKRIILQAQTQELGEAREEVEIASTAPETSILVNFRYLLDALKAVGGDQAELAFSDNTSPVRLTAKGGGGSQHIIMPVRPN